MPYFSFSSQLEIQSQQIFGVNYYIRSLCLTQVLTALILKYKNVEFENGE